MPLTVTYSFNWFWYRYSLLSKALLVLVLLISNNCVSLNVYRKNGDTTNSVPISQKVQIEEYFGVQISHNTNHIKQYVGLANCKPRVNLK